jgi:gamma-glutamyltranspeptidase/glutathione hydrolase
VRRHRNPPAEPRRRVRLEPGHPNALAPGKRPLHTIIPGFLLQDGEPWQAFGLMGGPIQPQSHLNFVANVVDHGLNPQEALDHPRFRFERGCEVVVEAPEREVDEGGSLGSALAARGHTVQPMPSLAADVMGGGQAIARLENGVWAGGSDRRKDGCAQPFG